jgi:hypothetical protein
MTKPWLKPSKKVGACTYIVVSVAAIKNGSKITGVARLLVLRLNRASSDNGLAKSDSGGWVSSYTLEFSGDLLVSFNQTTAFLRQAFAFCSKPVHCSAQLFPDRHRTANLTSQTKAQPKAHHSAPAEPALPQGPVRRTAVATGASSAPARTAIILLSDYGGMFPDEEARSMGIAIVSKTECSSSLLYEARTLFSRKPAA